MTTVNLQTVDKQPDRIPFLPPTIVALPTKQGFELVREEEILYCKAEGNYTAIYFLGGRTLLISRKLKETTSSLADGWFLRIHQSYTVNLRYVAKYIRGLGGQLVLFEGKTLPISKKYKEEVLQQFKYV